jgi:hypothetical protein
MKVVREVTLQIFLDLSAGGRGMIGQGFPGCGGARRQQGFATQTAPKEGIKRQPFRVVLDGAQKQYLPEWAGLGGRSWREKK